MTVNHEVVREFFQLLDKEQEGSLSLLTFCSQLLGENFSKYWKIAWMRCCARLRRVQENASAGTRAIWWRGNECGKTSKTFVCFFTHEILFRLGLPPKSYHFHLWGRVDTVLIVKNKIKNSTHQKLVGKSDCSSKLHHNLKFFCEKMSFELILLMGFFTFVRLVENTKDSQLETLIEKATTKKVRLQEVEEESSSESFGTLAR